MFYLSTDGALPREGRHLEPPEHLAPRQSADASRETLEAGQERRQGRQGNYSCLKAAQIRETERLESLENFGSWSRAETKMTRLF